MELVLSSLIVMLSLTTSFVRSWISNATKVAVHIQNSVSTNAVVFTISGSHGRYKKRSVFKT